MRALLVLTLLLGGCLAATDPSASPGAVGGETAPADRSAPPASHDELGAIEVTVVTSELQPVPRAQILLEGTERTLFSGDDGLAVFSGLEPGPYTVIAAKPGHKSTYERGRAVEVIAAETSKVQFTLDPVEVVREGFAYHSTFSFRGFISCSYAIGGQSASSVCGRGVVVGGSTIGDPNDNSTHDFPVDNHQVRQFILESEWQPSIGALGSELFISLSATVTCNVYNYCAPDSQLGGAGGPSPIYYAYPATPTSDISTRFGTSPSDYPSTAYAAVRSYCPSGCTVRLTFNQAYNAFASVFYGEAPPVGWSVFNEG
jgi:hypothetical protein